MIENSEQYIIQAVSTMKEFEKFMKSQDEYVILMDLHLAFIEEMIRTAHVHKKKVFLHLDLIKGLTSDECGCEYACQVLHADGIISTKAKVIESGKKNRKITILRLFLIDSKSLEKGISLCNTLQPDYVEVLPGIASSILPYIREHTNTKIMCGGLLKSKDQIQECIQAGACAVTISQKIENMI